MTVPIFTLSDLWREVVRNQRRGGSKEEGYGRMGRGRQQTLDGLLGQGGESEEEEEDEERMRHNDPSSLRAQKDTGRAEDCRLEYVFPSDQEEDEEEGRGVCSSQSGGHEELFSGRNCKNRTIFYHFLIHYKFHILSQIRRRLCQDYYTHHLSSSSSSSTWTLERFLLRHQEWVSDECRRLETVFKRVHVDWKERGGGTSGGVLTPSGHLVGGGGEILLSGSSPFKSDEMGECLLMWSDGEEGEGEDDPLLNSSSSSSSPCRVRHRGQRGDRRKSKQLSLPSLLCHQSPPTSSSSSSLPPPPPFSHSQSENSHSQGIHRKEEEGGWKEVPPVTIDLSSDENEGGGGKGGEGSCCSETLGFSSQNSSSVSTPSDKERGEREEENVKKRKRKRGVEGIHSPLRMKRRRRKRELRLSPVPPFHPSSFSTPQPTRLNPGTPPSNLITSSSSSVRGVSGGRWKRTPLCSDSEEEESLFHTID